MNKHNDKLITFFDILLDDEDHDTPQIIKDLKLSGINYDRILMECNNLIKSAERTKKLNWLSDARKTREEVDDILKKQAQWIKSKYHDAKDLVQAIHAGSFGSILQERANAFFRNQDFKEMSDADLISFIEDCRLLEVLSKDDQEDE